MTDPIDPNAYPSYEPSPYGYGYPPPFDPAPAPAPESQRRTVLGFVGTLVVSVVAAALLTSWLIHDDPPKRLVLPDSFDGYTLLHNATSDQVESAMRSFATSIGGPAKSVFDSGTIGVYGKGDAPSLIVFALPTGAASGASSDPSVRVDELLGQLLPSPEAFPAGRHGGSEKCGLADLGTLTDGVCAWSDARTSGLVVAVNPPLTPGTAAEVTVALRDRID